MSLNPDLKDSLREAILAKPDAVLDDSDVMRALIDATEKAMGGNVIDMRGMAMERLEARLDRLVDTHRNVLSAAYENLASTQQVHRAVDRMLEPLEFEEFLRLLESEIAQILGVDKIVLLLESAQATHEPAVERFGSVLRVVDCGFIAGYLNSARGSKPRRVTLRRLNAPLAAVYGPGHEAIRSEACLALDFGADRLPGLLVFGAKDADKFSPHQGTDLLSFFAGVFEKTIRRWLSCA